ncbi:lipoyl synthase [candidate division KSB1 bacterium]
MGLTAQNRIHEETVRGTVSNERKPDWLKVSFRASEEYAEVKYLIEKYRLNTVCSSARCPNIGECWGHKTATFMILGNTCSRSCGFCAVETGKPNLPDLAEPKRVAEAVEKLGLKHVVITSVNRDELEDGGAGIWARTITEVRRKNPECRIEVLIPDFQGSTKDLETVLEANPDVLNHNLETVKRLYKSVRPQADYDRSLSVIRYAKNRGAVAKSGIMVGIGETNEEVLGVMRDLYESGCDIMTVGQYLQPSKRHLPVHRFVLPDEFDEFKRTGLALGFKHVESGPLVRSSYHAHKQII